MKSTELTCPHCQTKTDHAVHTNATVVGYQCKGCNKDIVHDESSCCAICNYSDGTCPLHDQKAPEKELNG